MIWHPPICGAAAQRVQLECHSEIIKAPTPCHILTCIKIYINIIYIYIKIITYVHMYKLCGPSGGGSPLPRGHVNACM